MDFKYNDEYDDENEDYQQEFAFQAKSEAKNILKAFIKTEDEAELIKANVNRKKPTLIGKQFQFQHLKQQQNEEQSLEDDIELAFNLIKEKRLKNQIVNSKDFDLNVELRQKKLQQKRQSQQKQNSVFSSQSESSQKSIASSSKSGSQNTRELGFRKGQENIQTNIGQKIKNESESRIKDKVKNELCNLKNKRKEIQKQSVVQDESEKQVKSKEQEQWQQHRENVEQLLKNDQAYEDYSENIREVIGQMEQEALKTKQQYNEFRVGKLQRVIDFYILGVYRRKMCQDFLNILKENYTEDLYCEEQSQKILKYKKLKRMFSRWLMIAQYSKDFRECEIARQKQIDAENQRGNQENSESEEDAEIEKMSFVYYERNLMRKCLISFQRYRESKLEMRNQQNPVLKTKIKDFIKNLKQEIVNDLSIDKKIEIKKQELVLERQKQLNQQIQENVNEEISLRPYDEVKRELLQQKEQNLQKYKENVMKPLQQQIKSNMEKYKATTNINNKTGEDNSYSQQKISQNQEELEIEDNEFLESYLDLKNQQKIQKQQNFIQEEFISDESEQEELEPINQKKEQINENKNSENINKIKTEKTSQEQSSDKKQSGSDQKNKNVSENTLKKEQAKLDKLKEIEERSKKRKEMNEQIKKKHEDQRKMKDQEKKRLEQQKEEEEKRQKQEEIQQILQKKKEEKERKEKLEWEKKRLNEKMKQAEEYSNYFTMKFYGFKPLQKLLEKAHSNIIKAEKFDYERIQKTFFNSFLKGINILRKEKYLQEEYMIKQADNHYNLKMQRKYFLVLLKNQQLQQIEDQKYDQKRGHFLKRQVLQKWYMEMTRIKRERYEHENQRKQIVEQFRKVILCEKVFKMLKQNKEDSLIEKQKEKHKKEMWNKVNGWLNKFQSSEEIIKDEFQDIMKSDLKEL